MADDDDDEIGWQIVGAVRREIEPAHGATIVDLQKGTEQLAFAAARATAAKPALQGGPKIAFFDRAGLAGPDLVGGGHGLPYLALFLPPDDRKLQPWLLLPWPRGGSPRSHFL